MKTVNFTQLRANLAGVLDGVTDNAEEAVVVRTGHEPVVIVSMAEYTSLKETEYLLSNPGYAAELRQSIAEAQAGQTSSHTLDELTSTEVSRNGVA